MKKWCFLLAVLLLLPLSACGSSETLDRFYGRVEEVQRGPDGALVQRGPDGALSALVLQNEEGVREGILLTEETHVASAVEEVLTEAQFLEQTPLGTEVSGYFLEDVPGQTLSAQDGSEYSARTAHLLVVEEAKRPEGCTLSDGTQVEVWWDGGHNTYRLPDGTELLWEDPPETRGSPPATRSGARSMTSRRSWRMPMPPIGTQRTRSSFSASLWDRLLGGAPPARTSITFKPR